VFCIMFITCQLLDIDYRVLHNYLLNDPEETFVDMFKRMLFG
jgi:hypothetical protein